MRQTPSLSVVLPHTYGPTVMEDQAAFVRFIYTTGKRIFKEPARIFAFRKRKFVNANSTFVWALYFMTTIRTQKLARLFSKHWSPKMLHSEHNPAYIEMWFLTKPSLCQLRVKYSLVQWNWSSGITWCTWIPCIQWRRRTSFTAPGCTDHFKWSKLAASNLHY